MIWTRTAKGKNMPVDVEPSGDGGFYHWARLPEGMTGDSLNELLFEHDAGILPGRLCDMARPPEGGRSTGTRPASPALTYGPTSRPAR